RGACRPSGRPRAFNRRPHPGGVAARRAKAGYDARVSSRRDEERRWSGREWQAPLEDQLQSVDLVDLLADMSEPERADEGKGGRVVRTDGGDARPNATGRPRPVKQRPGPLTG